MSPAIRDGEMVYVRPAEVHLRRGDIVLVKGDYGFRLHRLVKADAARDVFITRGDCGQQDDPPLRGEQILGVAVAKEVRLGRRSVRTNLRGVGGMLLRGAARGQSVANNLLRATGLHRPARAKTSRPMRGAANLLGALGLLLVLLAAPYLRAQVAVDATTSHSNERTGAGTVTVTFNHTTTATANRLLIVGVSINIAERAYHGSGRCDLQRDAAEFHRRSQ